MIFGKHQYMFVNNFSFFALLKQLDPRMLSWQVKWYWLLWKMIFFLFLRKIISSNQSCIAKVTVRARKSHFLLSLSRAQLSHPIYLCRRQAWPKIWVSGQAKSNKFWLLGSIKVKSIASLLNFVSVKNYKNKKGIKKSFTNC